MRTRQWIGIPAFVLMAIGLVYGAGLGKADETNQTKPRFGLACIGKATAGTAYYYTLTLGPAAWNPSGLPQPPQPPIPIRIVVTSVKTLNDGAELTARLDKLKSKYDQERDGLMEYKLVRNRGKGQILSRDFMAGGSGYPGIHGIMANVPDFLLGYPDFESIPEGQSAVVRNLTAGGPARWTQSVYPKTANVVVVVDYYAHAHVRDVEAGAKVLYWVKDKAELVDTVPNGQEAAPLLQRGVPYPQDPKVSGPRQFNVVPVEVGMADEQVWKDGAIFPDKIIRSVPITNLQAGLLRGLVFEADLVKVGTGPIVPPHPETLGPPRPQAPTK